MIPIFRVFTKASSLHWNWITLSGPDAVDFLHRVTTVNVKALPIGKGMPGCLLNPQGKIRAYFKLWHFDSEGCAFEFDAGTTDQWKRNLLTAIDEYTFAEKMTLTDLSFTLECCWIFPDEEFLIKNDLGQLEVGSTTAIERGIRICNHGTSDYGRPWMTCWAKPSILNEWVDEIKDGRPLDFQEIEVWRIRALRPKVDTEIKDTIVPLEIGLKDSISENKGCYPGQEVIEKIIALGSPARRLALIEGVGSPPEVGEKITNFAEPPADVGMVTSSIQVNEKFIALGLVRKIHAKEGLEVQFENSRAGKGAIVQVTSYA